MPEIEIDVDPILHITTDAIGKPGQRVFYIQAWQEDHTVCLLVEKVHLQSLAVGVEQFLQELSQRFPELEQASAEFDEQKMHIHPPVDPLFRVGELGVAYDSDRDQLILVARELRSDDRPTEDLRVVRFWCTRSQLRAMSRWGLEV
ncbi:MAG: DUF3090 family protein, partial [Anaerolineaceae bacterium]|nr:DUF3090 family protein [Anaerolineaceae bacterium]